MTPFPRKRTRHSVIARYPLVAGQSTGSFSTEDGAVTKTAYIAEGAYTYEMADTYGDGMCCQCGAGRLKITANGEPVATSSSGEFREVGRERLFVVGRVTNSNSDYRLGFRVRLLPV
jgi:hypothetical protein